MLFFLGMLSFFQIVFIPGFILLRLSKLITKNIIQTIIYSFSLSLIVNYLVVFFLTAMHIYKPLVIYIFIALELFILAYITYREIINANNFKSNYINLQLFFKDLKKMPVINILIFLLYLLCISF